MPFRRLAAVGKLFGPSATDIFLDIGVPEILDRGGGKLSARRNGPTAFLDRDGILNADHRDLNAVPRPALANLRIAWLSAAVSKAETFICQVWGT